MAFPSQLNINYSNKAYTANERKLYADYFREMIQRYGVCVYYYQNTYNKLSANNLYGEDTVTGFQPAKPILMLVDIPNESILFSKFGLQTDADFNAIISVGDWFNTFTPAITAEPKAGDVVRIINTGWDESETSYTYLSAQDTFLNILNQNAPSICDVDGDGISDGGPNGSGNINGGVGGSTLFICSSAGDWRRFPQMYQITEIRYQDIGSGINFLMGHYVWLIRGKRFDYAYEPNIHPEPIKDNSLNPNDYNQRPRKDVVDDENNNFIDESSKDIFDYNQHPGSNTSPYGNY